MEWGSKRLNDYMHGIDEIREYWGFTACGTADTHVRGKRILWGIYRYDPQIYVWNAETEHWDATEKWQWELLTPLGTGYPWLEDGTGIDWAKIEENELDTV